MQDIHSASTLDITINISSELYVFIFCMQAATAQLIVSLVRSCRNDLTPYSGT